MTLPGCLHIRLPVGLPPVSVAKRSLLRRRRCAPCAPAGRRLPTRIQPVPRGEDDAVYHHRHLVSHPQIRLLRTQRHADRLRRQESHPERPGRGTLNRSAHCAPPHIRRPAELPHHGCSVCKWSLHLQVDLYVLHRLLLQRWRRWGRNSPLPRPHFLPPILRVCLLRLRSWHLGVGRGRLLLHRGGCRRLRLLYCCLHQRILKNILRFLLAVQKFSIPDRRHAISHAGLFLRRCPRRGCAALLVWKRSLIKDGPLQGASTLPTRL